MAMITDVCNDHRRV